MLRSATARLSASDFAYWLSVGRTLPPPNHAASAASIPLRHCIELRVSPAYFSESSRPRSIEDVGSFVRPKFLSHSCDHLRATGLRAQWKKYVTLTRGNLGHSCDRESLSTEVRGIHSRGASRSDAGPATHAKKKKNDFPWGSGSASIQTNADGAI